MFEKTALAIFAIVMSLPASAGTNGAGGESKHNAREVVTTYQLNDSQLTTPGPAGVARVEKTMHVAARSETQANDRPVEKGTPQAPR